MTAALTVAEAAPRFDVRTLLAVAVVILAARLAGWAGRRVGQPAVCGEIIAGIALGPSLLGVLWPGAGEYLFGPAVVGALQVLANVGLVLFMFLVGVELDLGVMRGHGHRAVAISHASIAVPVVLGGALGWWLQPTYAPGVSRLGFLLFFGAAMAVTAFPVLVRVLQDTGLYGTRIGVLTVTCAAVDDITAWCLLAAVVAVVSATDIVSAAAVLVWSLVFVGVMLGVVRPLLRRAGTVPVWAAVVLALAAAFATERIGIHAIFGAFLAGAVMPRGATAKAVTDKLETTTATILLPVFFIVVGLSTRIDLLTRPELWALAGAVTLVAVAGKLGGSALVARLTGESWRDATLIGVLMNTRGLTELVILTVGLQLGVIGPTIFTVMVLMALATTLMAPPVLSVAMRRRQPLAPPERAEAAGELALTGS